MVRAKTSATMLAVWRSGGKNAEKGGEVKFEVASRAAWARREASVRAMPAVVRLSPWHVSPTMPVPWRRARDENGVAGGWWGRAWTWRSAVRRMRG